MRNFNRCARLPITCDLYRQASVVFTSLARVVRDTAQSVNRQAVFRGLGGEIRVDANVIGSLQGALLQLVRNTVAHGIESGAQRTAAAKSPIGMVTLRVMQRGRRVAFACSDDGRGIDLSAVVRIAKSRGLIPPGTETPGREELLRLILKSGMTTAVNVSDVSGRGIGLDVAREAADRLGGEIDIQTEAGKGTTIESWFR
jgi:two-component system chemotaxis sensor kinase CheA